MHPWRTGEAAQELAESDRGFLSFFYSFMRLGEVNYGAVDEEHRAGACRYNGTENSHLAGSNRIESIWTQLLAADCVPSTLKPSGLPQ